MLVDGWRMKRLGRCKHGGGAAGSIGKDAAVARRLVLEEDGRCARGWADTGRSGDLDGMAIVGSIVGLCKRVDGRPDHAGMIESLFLVGHSGGSGGAGGRGKVSIEEVVLCGGRL